MALKNDLSSGRTGSNSINKALTLSVYDVAGLPSASAHPQRVIWVTNGNGGTACAAVSNGTSWLRIVPGIAVAAT